MNGLMKFQNRRPNLFSLFDDVMFGDNFKNLNSFSQPSVNIKEAEDLFLLELAAPGLKKEDFNIEIEQDQLILSAEKESTKEEYSRREFNYSSFTKTFHLDQTIDSDKISAQYEDGILSMTLPKKEEAKKETKRIEIG